MWWFNVILSIIMLIISWGAIAARCIAEADKEFAKQLGDEIKPLWVGALVGFVGVILAHSISQFAFWTAVVVLMGNFLFGYFAYKHELNRVNKKVKE